ncbi:leucine-rich repeat protein [Brachyspira hyodysenteriae]|uniref:leucine-rich repeat protein n=1 Tax=Brachyspira hyodysenteriae TaxID=159 RepID=UPI000A154C8A|nr:leucine-rich repeat protein [Brachyspira hyodysenteriae]
MKKITALFILISLMIISCKYKIVSPIIDIDDGNNIYNNNGNNGNNNNQNLYTVGANSSEEEVRNSLEKNKQLTGKNLIIVEGYINQASLIFDNIKKVINGKTDIELDLSMATLESNFKGTLENSIELTIVLLPSSRTLVGNFLKGCTSVTSIQLQKTLDTIDPTSFSGCTSLKNVEYLGTSPNIINGTPFTGLQPADLYLPNVKTDPGDQSWDNFLGSKWNKIHYNASMPK